MADAKKRVPALRFPEFSGEWDEKLGGNIFDNIVDKKHNSDLRLLAISQEYGAIPRDMIDYNVSVSDKSVENYKVVQPGDFIISLRSFQGGIEYSEYYGLCSPAYIILRPNSHNINKYFYKHFFKTPSYILDLNRKLEGIRDGKMVSYKYFSEIGLPLPSLIEQTKIADFLSAADERIGLLKHQKALLEEYKRGAMQQIFSRRLRFRDQNGNVYPEWRKVKLGDVGDFQTSSIDKLSRDDEQQVFMVNYMNVYRHEAIDNSTKSKLQVVTAKDSQIISNNLKRGDILFTPSSETPDDIGHSVVIFEDLDNCVYSYHLLRFRPKIELNILYSHYFCNIPHVLGQLTKLATGSTRFTISTKAFASVDIELPCIEEQKRIADYLSAIDAKIALSQEQIVLTENFKKGLLQQLFV